MSAYDPEKLRRAMEAREHTQQQAAQEMGVSLSSIQKWLAGRHPQGLYLERVLAYIRGEIRRVASPGEAVGVELQSVTTEARQNGIELDGSRQERIAAAAECQETSAQTLREMERAPGDLLGQLSDQGSVQGILDKLSSLAWRRYHIPLYEAEEVAQAAIATYVEVHERYADQENHHGILFGIFRKKCLEHIDRSVRDHRRFRDCCASADTPRVNPRQDPEGGGSLVPPLECLIREEDAHLIHEALDQLQPEACAMLRLLIIDGMSRQDLLEHYGINANTLDWRLHTYRKEFRELLRQKGILGASESGANSAPEPDATMGF